MHWNRLVYKINKIKFIQLNWEDELSGIWRGLCKITDWDSNGCIF